LKGGFWFGVCLFKNHWWVWVEKRVWCRPTRVARDTRGVSMLSCEWY